MRSSEFSDAFSPAPSWLYLATKPLHKLAEPGTRYYLRTYLAGVPSEMSRKYQHNLEVPKTGQLNLSLGFQPCGSLLGGAGF